jgi:hypothetical protein
MVIATTRSHVKVTPLRNHSYQAEIPERWGHRAITASVSRAPKTYVQLVAEATDSLHQPETFLFRYIISNVYTGGSVSKKGYVVRGPFVVEDGKEKETVEKDIDEYFNHRFELMRMIRGTLLTRT